MPQYFLPVKKFSEEPYSNILGFPNPKKSQVKTRLLELKKNGVIVADSDFYYSRQIRIRKYLQIICSEYTNSLQIFREYVNNLRIRE